MLGVAEILQKLAKPAEVIVNTTARYYVLCHVCISMEIGKMVNGKRATEIWATEKWATGKKSNGNLGRWIKR